MMCGVGQGRHTPWNDEKMAAWPLPTASRGLLGNRPLELRAQAALEPHNFHLDQLKIS